MEENNNEQEKFIKTLHAGIEMLMQKKEGRIFLLHILNETGVLKTCYTMENILFFEGRRSIGTELISLIQEQNKNNLSKLFEEK